jgi:hypothetical protein
VFEHSLAQPSAKEKDPTGRSPNEAGAKLDHGKVRPALVLGGFARALTEVAKVGSFGAAKYSEDGWVSVPNGVARYSDAGLRHWLAKQAGEDRDQDSHLDHLAHAAWNALAVLDLEIRKREGRNAGPGTVGAASKAGT